MEFTCAKVLHLGTNNYKNTQMAGEQVFGTESRVSHESQARHEK